MGFRAGAYAKVWEVTPDTETKTKLKISVTRKYKEDFIVEFSGYVQAVGTVCAAKAAKLKPGDRIKLGDTDTRNYYNKEKKKEYYDLRLFGFELQNGSNDSGKPVDKTDVQPVVDEGEIDDSRELPF